MRARERRHRDTYIRELIKAENGRAQSIIIEYPGTSGTKHGISLAQFELPSARAYRELENSLIDHLLILHYLSCHTVSYSLSDSIML